MQVVQTAPTTRTARILWQCAYRTLPEDTDSAVQLVLLGRLATALPAAQLKCKCLPLPC